MGHHPRRSASLRVVAGVAAAVAVLAGPAGRADAHPMGPPQQATVSLAAANKVQIVWKFGAMDDISWLAYDLGLLPSERIMLDGAITPQASDAELVQKSPALTAYLTKQMAVTSSGRACTPQVAPPTDIANLGTTVVFTCSGPVSQATVELQLLTDLEASYATIATGPDGTQATYTGYATTRDWSFDPTTAPAASDGFGAAGWTAWFPQGLPVAAAIGLPLAVGGTIWLVRTRRRSS
ncbi:MAG: hypothetical protein CVT62_06355 [Actinobacteria bacterium HGW-Actinobacteria-2]|nr:MAG: hypothetical protein CVT62_06355 [Actinobacteria bacterium HGW-Actinobacteria-2]